MLDRIDGAYMRIIEVPRVDYEKLSDDCMLAVFLAALSTPGYHPVPRRELARWRCTIAHLTGEGTIAPTHLAEALQYRPILGIM